MGYVDSCAINKAREMDLLTYLQNYEPQELISCGKGTFCTREHDSLKISNGKWFWFSRGIGGKSALDYLVNVKDVPFTEAVEIIFWIGFPKPSIELQMLFKCFDSFEAMIPTLEKMII